MANLVKASDIKFIDDLKDPTLGHVIKDESLLMFTWGAIGIAAILYIPGVGFISALVAAYMGYRDVKATTKKGETPDPEGNQSYLQPTDNGQETRTQKAEALPSTTQQSLESMPDANYGPEFVDNPWAKPRPSRPLGESYYKGEVYDSPEEKQRELGGTALAEFRAPNVNELLKLPIQKRAEKMLSELALSGCDLGPYIYDKVLIATGTQRSGKSTIVVIIGILEAALLGKELRYITSDGDIYPVAFSGIANGSKYYSMAAKEIESTQLGQASNIVWIFDEITKQDTETKTQLWEQLLTGFVKTGASARLITHGITMKAIGFPVGMSDQVKSESVILKAQRESDLMDRSKAASLPNGGHYPSGSYKRQELHGDCLRDVAEEHLQLPDWLLFDTNEQGNPCYVRSLLKYFPELDSRVNAAAPPELYPEPPDPIDTMATQRTELEAAWLSSEGAIHPVEAQVVAENQGLTANASQFASLVISHLATKDLKVVSLARLLADNYTLKSALKQTSADPEIRDKGKETARTLAMQCKKLNLLTVEDRGGNSINLSAPPAPLFGSAR